MKKQKIDNRLSHTVFLALVVVLVAIYGINIYATNNLLGPIKASAEKQRPANLHLTLVTNDCQNCFDMNQVAAFVKKQENVKIILERNLLDTDKEAQGLIAENKIKSLPALIITGEVSQSNIAPLWDNLGVQPLNGAVVLSDMPPYYSLDARKVVGLVQAIRLTDNSCAECYDVEAHMQILPRFGIYVDKSLTYDISSNNSKELLQKYNITKVPTIILSSDASVYLGLNQIWNQVGTVEEDGSYIFRATEQMGIYKDLSNNTIVNATQ